MLDTERGRLLRRIAEAQVPHRHLSMLVLEAEGLDAFTDAALRRMGAVLDVIVPCPTDRGPAP
jgi:hypothetical protein